ncbi:DMT family transporter [Ferruginivarius sediminum]|uniref:DMT family transporter n=1 Tax=Ferruginivarius sediminum TaxID=2661937 RepID=A0A369TEL8_9PROT|nr:DMT family transporter [Ferruginivarius sediminum]RDD63700.1 DMT family transporter [Ferruginivarius sediminum]
MSRAQTLHARTADGTRPYALPDGGVALVAFAVVLFSVYNALTKWLAADYDPLQIVFFRGLFGLLPVALILLWHGGGTAVLRSRRPGVQVLRAVLALAANICFILSYRAMPLADAVAIGYAAPIFVTALSVPMLSERVGVHRWSAVLVGFLGVLLVARPGVGVFEPAALLAIFGTLLYALSIIATRRLGTLDAAITTMAHSTSLYVIICALALPFVWVTPTWTDLAFFLALGLVGGVGMFCFVQAYRMAEATKLAPFDYTAMVWATIFGFAIWGEVPTLWSVAGISVIAGSGLYIVHREHVTRRTAAAQAALAGSSSRKVPAKARSAAQSVSS